MKPMNMRYNEVTTPPENPVEGAYDKPEPYLPTPELVKAVNLAIFLQRPLLLEGEAGCGKSRLAHSVAYQLGLPLRVWSIRSTSEAKEGLYTYDALLRLHDVHLHREMNGNPKAANKPIRDPSDPTDYRKFGPLGEAFYEQNHPSVVLIDEIDKADLDFPNDLLTVLEEPREFYIPETDETIRAAHSPILIITSNKEKGNLPRPFLRRCVYYYMRFPDDETSLKNIIAAHQNQIREEQPERAEPDVQLIEKAIALFRNVRKTPMQKLPGTSELLDWVEALLYFETPFQVTDLPDKVGKDIPYLELLYKLRMDLTRLEAI